MRLSKQINSILKATKFGFTNKLTVPLPFADLTLKEKDPELYNLLEEEQRRQWIGIELIASENYTSRAVMECLGKKVLTFRFCANQQIF